LEGAASERFTTETAPLPAATRELSNPPNMKTASAIPVALIVAILALGSTSCSSTGSAVGSEISASGPVIIEKGMPAADLVAALGEPDKVEPVDPPRDGFEIWTYSKRKQDYDLKVTGYKETPYWNPITGVYTPIKDPVYKSEMTTITRETEFLIGEGVVLTWKDETKADRRYSD
jgi:hypothetical protein